MSKIFAPYFVLLAIIVQSALVAGAKCPKNTQPDQDNKNMCGWSNPKVGVECSCAIEDMNGYFCFNPRIFPEADGDNTMPCFRMPGSRNMLEQGCAKEE
ncbi:unnamed protein product [Bursaphelenchus xylophilus]|uniref:(pine wood nematode) hypothetical protein n=1 Tax=Bursaphelenchus xylophilus TaxID=6326 RepID=A0A1I7S1R6_BURXY|nr:unnamed protein product [Bursaphelenchus xylophilus]CAG9089843.1 unnamed protein product [Bursaphelenchus xylophilus]